MAKSLPIPAPAKRDPQSVEMVRAWISEKKLHVALNIGFWEQPERGIDERDAWGILMADMARHIANAHETEYGRDPRETLEAVVRALADGAEGFDSPELISVLAGEAAPLGLAELQGMVNGQVELELRDGGQSAYWWLLAAE